MRRRVKKLTKVFGGRYMQHGFEKYVHVPDILGISTNIRGFRWGFGECSTPAGEDAFDRCRIKVFLEAKKDREVFDGLDLKDYTEVFRDFKAKPQAKAVIFEKKLRALRLRFSVSVQDDRVSVTVGRSYLRYIKLKLMYIHPIAYVLFDIVSMLLLQQNMTTLYCSAARLKNERSIVCFSPPNTGKSLTVLQLKKKYGARIIAEDMAVTDGESIWGAPYTGLYRDYNDDSLNAVGKNIENDTFVEKIDAAFVLQKGSSDHETASDECADKITLINRYSLGYYYSPCVRVLDYYNRDFDVKSAQMVEDRILSKIASDAMTYIVEKRNSMDFADFIHTVMNEENT